jgi:hypothetical protein
MRTTVTIRDDLLRRARQLALARSCTLSELVEESLQQALAGQQAGARPKPGRPPTFRGRGLQPGVDLDNSASLIEIMEGR